MAMRRQGSTSILAGALVALTSITLAAWGSALVGCSTLGSIANEGVDFAGAKADVHCDRRFVTDGGQPAAFCQDVSATVAAAEFSDDCRAKHQATPGPGLCPRARIIAGCLLHKKNDDESIVHDWYYDVSDLIAEAGPNAGPDGGQTFDSRLHSLGEVRAACADPTRYEEGAEPATP
jgi:hypothetical protein